MDSVFHTLYHILRKCSYAKNKDRISKSSNGTNDAIWNRIGMGSSQWHPGRQLKSDEVHFCNRRSVLLNSNLEPPD